MQLSQIVPMDEGETGEEGPAIVNAKILDPYLILLRVDGSVLVYKLDKSMELAEEESKGIKVSRSRVSVELWLMDRSIRVSNTSLDVSTRLDRESYSQRRREEMQIIFSPSWPKTIHYR